MHRSKLADQLLGQIQTENGASVLMISEQYENKARTGWMSDNTNTAAIWLPNPKDVTVTHQGKGDGYVWAQTEEIAYVSCYLTPNEPIDAFQQKLNKMEDDIIGFKEKLLLAGDFNAKAVEWGMTSTDSRGKRILEMASRLGLNVINLGNTSTFRRPGYGETIPDVTFASEAISAMISNWKVMECYTASDHQYITWNIGADIERQKKSRMTGWNTSKLNEGNLVYVIENSPENSQIKANHGTAEELTKQLTNLITKACDASMPRRKSGCDPRKPKYWWTEEISDLRKECLRHRRKLLREKRNNTQEPCQSSLEYKTKRKELKSAIEKSKREHWNLLINEVENDPWGLGYKIVTDKILPKTAGPVLGEKEMIRIVDALFPDHPTLMYTPMEVEEKTPTIIPFSEDELLCATNSLRSKKAPGPDGIPTEILKVIAKSNPEILLNVLNTCLREMNFPKQWKTQRLVLISKGKGDPNSPSAYRPLCMLNTLGKLYEKMLQPRLHEAVENGGGLSKMQHGFRKGFSTIGAIQEVVKTANETQRGNRFSRNLLILVTLDVKNAFNSASWRHILEALEKLNNPRYLINILSSYLSDRRLIFDTMEGPRSKEITAGAAQGSILGPDLWNIFYDGVLRLEMTEGTRLIGYADDVAALIESRNIDDAQRKLNQTMRRVLTWMEHHGLSLAMEKTEITIITPKRMPENIGFNIENEVIATQNSLKYLGITIDRKLNFWEHIKRAADKASKTTTQLSRLMANVGGASSSKRKVIMAVTHSILLYGSEIWADSLKHEKYRKRMAAVQRRGALRITSAYRTVSEPAVLVIAGVIPVALLAEERKQVYQTKQELGKKSAAEEARKNTLAKWQTIWESEQRGRWTAKLIPKLKPWIERKHGEVTYHLTQLLTGHGCFNKYLFNLNIKNSAACDFCEADTDDVEHTLFVCRRWDKYRAGISNFTADTIIEGMILDESIWKKVVSFAEAVLRVKAEKK